MDECIEWQKCKLPKGYGLTRHKGKTHLAHRVAYCTHHGIDISDIAGVFVRHKCDNPSCVNPDHLELGTHMENMKDMRERKRSARGERNGFSKLDTEQVKEILRKYSDPSNTTRSLAKEYGVSQSAISTIVNSKNWGHIQNDIAGLSASRRKTKLTETDVRLIRNSDLTDEELSSKYGITAAAIKRVRNRSQWKNVI